MEEQQQQNPLVITHLLRHTLRSLCSIHENSNWVYAVFWRILPRNFPPPKWDFHGGGYDRARGSKRNWILVWEDGFCNFTASAAGPSSSATYTYGDGGGGGNPQPAKGLQPELFFKMSHEIYNYGEGLIGKVSADHGHKWVYTEPQEQEINIVTEWNSPADSHPRTWEAQFQSGIKTIALIAVQEGVVQLGAVNKIMEDLSFVVYVRKKFAYLESIPGVLLPHPSASSVPIRIDGCAAQLTDSWLPVPEALATPPAPPTMELYDYLSHQMRITPSMSSLEALLSKLPSVGPPMPGQPQPLGCFEMPILMAAPAVGHRPSIYGIGGGRMAKEEVEDFGAAGESSSSMPYSFYANVSKSGDEV